MTFTMCPRIAFSASALCRFIFIFTMLALSLPLTVSAQSTLPVRSIEVQFAGPSNISREKVLANMRTTVGQPYSAAVVDDDIRGLYSTGEVSNVRIFTEPASGGVKVVVVIQSKAIIKEIIVEGSQRVSAKRLRKEVTLKPGQPLSEDVLEADRQKMVEIYNKRGFKDIDIQYKVNSDEKTGLATVLFSVFEGDRSNVRGITFEGNEHVPTKALRKLLKTKPRNILTALMSQGRLKDSEVQEDVEKLKEYYQNLGYIDVDVADVRIDRVNDRTVNVTYVIREGIQYTIGRFGIEGNRVFSQEELRAVIKTKEGAVYSPGTLREDMKTIGDMYGERGYVDLQLIPEGTPGGSSVVNLKLAITEGGPSTVAHINIEGNTRTKDKVIRRELAVSPGELYDTVAVEASKARLKNLDYFSQVDTVPSSTGVLGEKDLNVIVQEKRTGALNFGVGFSTVDNLIGFIELQQSNFDVMNWPSFTGGGQRFRVRLDYGAQRKDFVVNLTEPWFLDQQLALGGSLYYRDQDYLSSEYNQNYYGGDVFLRKPLGEFASVQLGYKIQEISIDDVNNGASQVIQQQAGSQLKNEISLGVTHDTRDSSFLTHRGHVVELNVFGATLNNTFDSDEYRTKNGKRTVQAAGADGDYGVSIEGSQYFTLPWLDMILLLQTEFSTVSSIDGGVVPIFDRLYLGGAYDLRGFDYRDVGPVDRNNDPIGGKSLGRFTTELTIPIIERVRGAVFFDAGFVNKKAWDFSTNDLNSDYGIGLRMNLPVGPIRLDYGIPIQASKHNNSSGRFNFSVGYQF